MTLQAANRGSSQSGAGAGKGRRSGSSPSALLLALLLSLAGGLAPPMGLASAQLVPPREITQPATQLPAWKEQWSAARDLVRRQRFREAAEIYEELLARRDHLNEARWELARLWRQLGEPERAMEHLELLREAVPDDPEYARELAAVSLAAGRGARAAELFAERLAATPDDEQLLAGLVAALLSRERVEEALPHLERLVELQGREGEAAVQLARLYHRLGRPGQALPLLRRLTAGATVAPELWRLAAEVHEELGRPEQAVDYWRRLLAVEPAHAKAAARLEAYMLTVGQDEEALGFLRSALADDPHNPRLLRRLAEVYLNLEQPARALPHLAQYLQRRPDDREVLLLTLAAHEQLGQQAEALPILERLLALEGEVAPENLRSAARLYRRQGRHHRALELYSEILRHHPDDTRLLAEKLHLLALLDRQREIGAILDHPRWRPRAAEILAAWHELAPEDRQVMIALAFVYLERGDMAGSERILRRLAELYPDDPEMLRARASWREKNRLPLAALRDYEEVLRRQPRQAAVRQRALRLAAELGLVGRVEEHLRHPAALGAEPAPDLRRAQIRLTAMDIGRSLEDLTALAQAHPAPVPILLTRAEAFRRLGLPYEAEETLRLALLQEAARPAVYRALFALALAEERYPDAEVWLAALERQRRFHPHQEDSVGRSAAEGESELGGMVMGGEWSQFSPAPELASPTVMRLRLLSGRGEHRAALRLLENMTQQPQARGDQFRLLAARVLWAADAVWSAERVVEELLDRPAVAPETLVLASLISERRGRPGAGEEYLARARAWAERDFGRQLYLAELLIRHRLYQPAAAVARQAAILRPDSVRAAWLRAEALAAAGDNRGALSALQALPAAEAALLPVRWRQLELLLHLGRLAEVVELSAELTATYPWSENALLLPRVHALWLQRQWRPALARLDASLNPAVSTRLAAGAQSRGVPVVPEQPPGLWGRLTGAVNPLQELTAEVMAPEYAAAMVPGDQRLRQVAAPLYAQYRWQQRFAMEQQARAAVQRRDFFAATREYERLVRNYPGAGANLYDLAGLYSRQQRWEAEAAIDRSLEEADRHYPGLATARLRNDLQRRPRSTLSYDYRRETGRDGYQALRRDALTFSQWWAPFLGHELEFALRRLRYQNTDGPGSLPASSAEIRYRRDVFAGVEVLLGLGGWMPAGNAEVGRDTLLARAELAGDLGDRLWGRVAYGRELVADTLASVGRGIRAETLSLAGAVDLLPRLEAGSAYRFHYFSDGNQTHGYDLSLNYTIFHDPTRLTAGYLYEFRDSRHGPQNTGPLLADGFAAADHPYWAPRSYWRKTFEVLFRHQLSDDPFRRDRPRYYTLRYASSYDSGGYGQQSLAADFFLELSPSFIWQAAAELQSGSDHRRRRLTTSLTYRW